MTPETLHQLLTLAGCAGALAVFSAAVKHSGCRHGEIKAGHLWRAEWRAKLPEVDRHA